MFEDTGTFPLIRDQLLSAGRIPTGTVLPPGDGVQLPDNAGQAMNHNFYRQRPLPSGSSTLGIQSSSVQTTPSKSKAGKIQPNECGVRVDCCKPTLILEDVNIKSEFLMPCSKFNN